MKFIFSLVLLASIAYISYAVSVTWGNRNSSDALLMRQRVVRTPLKNQYWSVNVEFPNPGQANQRTISAVIVYDHFNNKSGAQPSLWSGGPGWRFATVNLKSVMSGGINSTVEMYGR
ncbi:uncharacterized protein LOC119636066 [Glossina fuscipes]|uniref:Uncharacterized protein LOC119636066 n=1 Tax=Glossina fuscipes TaxID=7396 RepID=A0A8U0WN26_9MUSC|nr:uncharacterized protein LOC119636066 [Glossina fuscipes]KAI9583833.1 hypothetical protein GQX74_005581 [Glossina fuscipes]